MSLDQKFDALAREVRNAVRVTTKSNEVWISEKDAAVLIGIKPRTLRQMRYDGKAPKHRVRATGRGIQYLKSELDKLFITSK